jgi:hypothetical protein
VAVAAAGLLIANIAIDLFLHRPHTHSITYIPKASLILPPPPQPANGIGYNYGTIERTHTGYGLWGRESVGRIDFADSDNRSNTSLRAVVQFDIDSTHSLIWSQTDNSYTYYRWTALLANGATSLAQQTAIIVAAIVGWRVLRKVTHNRSSHRLLRGECPQCGYTLQGTQGCCPECGWGRPGAPAS